jgi:Cd2+/Zn2+-exporting ATPase
MKENKGKTAFMGDGINDAASIRYSNVGIAMGGIGSDIAVENADIVLMTDEPIKLYDAYKISKMTRNTAIFNIIFSLIIKFSIIILAAIFQDKFPMFIAVLANTGLTILMVINSLLLLYRKVKR